MTAAIRVDGVRVSYGEVVALDDVSFELAAGRVCGLIGANGSGKSTLFRALTGLVRPDRGRVALDGEPPAASRAAGRLAYVPQSEQVDWGFPVSVRDVVMMGRYRRLGITRRPRAADRAAVDAALERVELADLAGRQIGRLSGGQRKRAFVARGIAQGARTLLLDEPFAGVDARSEAMIVTVLRELAAGGATVLVSSHDLTALPRLADEAILLAGRILAHGPTREVLTPEKLALAFGLDAADPAGPGGAA